MSKVILHYNFFNEPYREGGEFFEVNYDNFEYEIELDKDDVCMTKEELYNKYKETALALAAYKLMK